MALKALQETIGYHFRDQKLLITALTHPSMTGEAHNQRLEFLGDAVLQLVMSERLYLAHPELMEGALSRLRARSVQESALHAAAARLGLGEHLRMGYGEESSGGRERASILADAMEALLGAVYLDGGLEAARKLALERLPEVPEDAARDYKTELQELLQKSGSTPRYRIVGQHGPAHAQQFIAEVIWEDQCIGTGQGASKKAAEQEAARLALSRHANEGEGNS